MTEQNIASALNNLINETPTDRPLSAGGDTNGECTAPIIKFYQKLGWPTPPMAGDTANGWGTNFPSELAPYVSHQDYQAGIAYIEGTVMMWDSPHIAIIVSSNGSNIAKVFEQNADPNGSYPKVYNRTINLPGSHMATYVLVPLITNDPMPKPYDIVAPPTFTPKLVVTKQTALKWDCSYPDLGTMEGHIVETEGPGLQFQANALLHHHATGDDYYLQDAAVPLGYLVSDCKDYVAPAPTPAPYIPPAAPLHVPVVTAVLTVVETIKTYLSAGDAFNDTNAQTAIGPGTYYIYQTASNGMQYIGKITGVKYWINPADNVLPTPTPPKPVVADIAPVNPTTWKDSWVAFHPSIGAIPQPDMYKAIASYEVTDIAGYAAPLALRQGQAVAVYGTFLKDGTRYYRLHVESDTQFKYFYGVPIFDTALGQAILVKKTSLVSSVVNTIYEAKSWIKDDGIKFLDDIKLFKNKK